MGVPTIPTTTENADAKPSNEDTKPSPFKFAAPSFSLSSNERPPPTPLRSSRAKVAAAPVPPSPTPNVTTAVPTTPGPTPEQLIKLKELENDGKAIDLESKKVDARLKKDTIDYLEKYTGGQQKAYISGSKDCADMITTLLSPSGRRRPHDHMSTADDEGAVSVPPSAFVGASPTTPGTFAQDVPGSAKRRKVAAKRPASGA